MPEKKDQHFVPKSYLRNFAIIDTAKTKNDVYICDIYIKEKREYKERLPSDVHCSIDYFYGKSGMEDELEKIETLALPIIEEIIDGNYQNITGNKIRFLYFFVALLYVRTLKSYKDFKIPVEKFKDSLADEKISQEVRNILDYNISPEELLEMTHDLLKSMEDLSCVILDNTTNKGFITSDNPVVTENAYNKDSTFYSTAISAEGILIILPISPKKAILIFDNEIYEFKEGIYRINDTEDIDALNALQYYNSDNLCFLACGTDISETKRYFEQLEYCNVPLPDFMMPKNVFTPNNTICTYKPKLKFLTVKKEKVNCERKMFRK